MKQVVSARKIIDWIDENFDNQIFSEGIYLMKLNHMFNALRSYDCDVNYVKAFLKQKLPWANFWRNRKTIKGLVVYSSKIFSPSFISKVVGRLYKFVY